MELVLEGGHRVDSNDTEALEKAAAVLEQEALEAAVPDTLEKAAEKGELTSEKAKKILKDGEVHGKPLTDQQRKYFGAVAGGTAKKSESISSIDDLANYGLEKAKRSLQAPKEWWDKTIKAVGATPKYKGYKPDRLAKIVGDIWANLDDKKKKEIRNRYGKEFGAAKSMDGVEALGEFAKAGGPFIGPRGGKWADAKHTIPWDEKYHGAPGKKGEMERKRSKMVSKHREMWSQYTKARDSGDKTKAAKIKGEIAKLDKKIDSLGEKLDAMERDKAKKKPTAEKPSKTRVDKLIDRFKGASGKEAEGLKVNIQSQLSHMEKLRDRYKGTKHMADKDTSLHEHYSKEANKLQSALKEAPVEKKPSKTGIPETEAREKRTAAMQKKLDALPKGTKFQISFKGGGGMKAHTSTVTAQGDGMWKMTTPGWPSTTEHTGDIAHHFVNVGGEGVNAPTSITGTGVEELTGEKPAKKSLTEWLNEQETDMSDENELMKALGEDAELVKGMMYGGKRVLEWADQFTYSATDELHAQALKCVKDMIACQKKWDAYNKGGKSWREVEEMPKTQRDAYRTKQVKVREAINKEEDAIRMKMRDLEAKLVDYRIKEVGMRQAMGKGGVEVLADFAKSGDDDVSAAIEVEVVENESGTSVLMAYLEKAQTMPAGEPGVSRGPKDGADLSRKTGPTGSGDSAASVIGAPGAGKKKKLSEDDDKVEDQLKDKKKPIERFTNKSLAVPGHQREMVAHEEAQLVSRLRKGPDDVTVGPGVPTPVVEPEPVRKAEQWAQGEEALVVYNDGADETAARLIKGEDFYAGGKGPTLGRNPMILTQRKVCKACEAIMSKSLAVCPHCGDGAGLKPQGALRIAVSARPGPGLQPVREPDIKIG